VKREFTWTPQMSHRLRLLDVFIALEVQVGARPNLALLKTFLEYRRVKGTHTRETTDYVSDQEVSENRIVPDAAFILENSETGRQGLFFVEMDMGSERLTAPKSADTRATVTGKFLQYDRYLTSGRFARTYEPFGDFQAAIILFVTFGAERIENIRKACAVLPDRLHPYYRLTTFEAGCADFLGFVWKSRDPSDTRRYALVTTAP
jgi:Replication-relaxation